MKNIPSHITIRLPEPDLNPVGIIQFVHGMAEHRQRYNEVMSYFTHHGYICAIADLPGHGENICSPDDLGYFGNNGHILLVEQIHDLSSYLLDTYTGLPYFMIGHSMGSLIARSYLKSYDNVLNGLILTGSPSDSAVKDIAKRLIRIMASFMGDHYKSRLIGNLVTGPFSKRFPNEGSPNSWITSDPVIWEKYDADEKCGFLFTLNGYETLMNLLSCVYSDSGWALQNPTLPVLFLSGKDDPCMTDINGFENAIRSMKCAGYINVNKQIYEGKRHEILNDFGKESVFKDILQYLTGVIKSDS